MKQLFKYITLALTAFSLITVSSTAALAAVKSRIGPYNVELSSQPRVIPVGKARLTIKLTDGAGKPVSGAQIRSMVMMPNMPMGEKEMVAAAQPSKPGVYT